MLEKHAVIRQNVRHMEVASSKSSKVRPKEATLPSRVGLALCASTSLLHSADIQLPLATLGESKVINCEPGTRFIDLLSVSMSRSDPDFRPLATVLPVSEQVVSSPYRNVQVQGGTLEAKFYSADEVVTLDSLGKLSGCNLVFARYDSESDFASQQQRGPTNSIRLPLASLDFRISSLPPSGALSVTYQLPSTEEYGELTRAARGGSIIWGLSVEPPPGNPNAIHVRAFPSQNVGCGAHAIIWSEGQGAQRLSDYYSAAQFVNWSCSISLAPITEFRCGVEPIVGGARTAAVRVSFPKGMQVYDFEERRSATEAPIANYPAEPGVNSRVFSVDHGQSRVWRVRQLPD